MATMGLMRLKGHRARPRMRHDFSRGEGTFIGSPGPGAVVPLVVGWLIRGVCNRRCGQSRRHPGRRGQGEGFSGEADLDDAVGPGGGEVVMRPGSARENHSGSRPDGRRPARSALCRMCFRK